MELGYQLQGGAAIKRLNKRFAAFCDRHSIGIVQTRNVMNRQAQHGLSFWVNNWEVGAQVHDWGLRLMVGLSHLCFHFTWPSWMKRPSRKIIMGCESRGDGESPYLVRWTLLDTPRGKLYLHRFIRSDNTELHDHPWDFWTIILRNGYIEELPTRWERRRRRRRRPGQVLYRPATHAHRVELIDGKEAWTLVWASRPRRDWGFFTWDGWQDWKSYFDEKGCR